MKVNQLACIGLLLVVAVVADDNLDAALFDTNVESNNVNEASPFWWMSKGSPFKRAALHASAPFQQQRVDFGNNPFLSGRPFAFADSEPAAAENTFARAGSYRAPGYLPPDNKIETVPCTGGNRVCVPRYQCVGGQIDASQVRGAGSQECRVDNEVCCSVRQPPPPPPPPTRAPPPPPTTARPTPPPTPAPQRCSPNSGCVPPSQCYNGVISGPAGYQQSAQVCYQPNVCCRNPPPPPPPTPFVPQESHDEFATRPPPPRPTPGPGLTSEGYFIQTPAATTARPVYTTPTPYVPPRNTPPPYKGDEYIPPKDNHIGEPSNTPNSYLPPNRGEQDKSEPIPRPSNDELSVIRPGGPTAPPPLPPIQCPAATNCTEVQFCTSDGVISKTPVILTRDQETYRVPLSDCRDLSRGITGKCCRDPDYVDPWPTSILGQYNATILGFDDGSYKPNPNELGAPARLTQPSQRGQGQLSLPIQGAQATQQTYTRTPFLQGVNSQNYKSTNTPEPNSISPREKPATNKYQQPQSHNPPKQQYQPQQHFLSQPQQHQSTGYTNAHPLIRHEVSEQQQQRQPQQPIVHRHVQRQSEPIQPNYEPFPTQPAFFQPIVAQEPQQFLQTIQPRQPLQPQQPVSQQQFPFDTQSFTKNPANGVCAIRDTTTIPRGEGPIDASFGEFPWQAMILKESTKTLICGGAIIDGDLVATSANCVAGIRPTDILIKGGEWKLGSNEEPKPFQLIRVQSITLHPAYQPTTLQSDIALLHLERKLKFDQHIGPICYDENDVEPNADEQCVTSGWGKEVLKHHFAGALPHSMPINPLSDQECQAILSANGYNPSTSICGKPQYDACDVDVGSALVCTRGDGKYLMKGLYSIETGCGASPSQLITFTKMDVPWLRSRGRNGGSPASARLQRHPEGQTNNYLPPQY